MKDLLSFCSEKWKADILYKKSMKRDRSCPILRLILSLLRKGIILFKDTMNP